MRIIGARGDGVPILVFETLEGFSVFVKDLSLVSTDVADLLWTSKLSWQDVGVGLTLVLFLLSSNSIKIGKC